MAIENVTIELVELGLSTPSDANGDFEFADLAVQSFQLDFTAADFQDISYTVSASGWGDFHQTFVRHGKNAKLVYSTKTILAAS